MDTYTPNPIASPRTLKQRIMRRIYVIFMVRNAAPLAFDVAALVALAFIATLFVSVRDVLANLSTAQSAGNLSGFSFSAVSDTELETKILLVALGIIGYFAVRHLRRAIQAIRTVRNGAGSSKPEV